MHTHQQLLFHPQHPMLLSLLSHDVCDQGAADLFQFKISQLLIHAGNLSPLIQTERVATALLEDK